MRNVGIVTSSRVAGRKDAVATNITSLTYLEMFSFAFPLRVDKVLARLLSVV